MVTKYRLYPCISQKQENKKKIKKGKKKLYLCISKNNTKDITFNKL